MVIIFLMRINLRASFWGNLVHEGTGFWKCNKIYEYDRERGQVVSGLVLVICWFLSFIAVDHGIFCSLLV